MRASALPPPPPAAPPGWYADPWAVADFRWWDGHAWAANVASRQGGATADAVQGRTPRLPAFLSVPVLVGAALVVPLLGVAAARDPVVLALVLVPLLFIVPVLVWIDRLEPEPWTSRLHTFLWGATIAVVVSAIVNSIVALSISETAAAVGSAPLVEETMKGLAIWWAVRRREVDGPVDGIVYAGWVAAGFAMIANVEYFFVAADGGVLAETFVVRAIFTPFAHPLFTVWIGLAIGWAVAGGHRLPWAAWWGWSSAVALHAAWHGAIVAALGFDDDRIVAVAASAFVVVFVATGLLVAAVRRRERREYLAAMPYVAQHYDVPAHEVGVFATWSDLLAHRRRLARRQRRDFDDVHASLARLAALHARPGPIDTADEQRLVDLLRDARAGLVRA